MVVTTLAPPAAEPVRLAEAKEYLRISGDGEEGLIDSLIAGARARIETLAGVAMISRTLRVTMDGWPQGAIERRTVVMPVRPADALVAVRVFDRAGEAEVVTGRFTLARGRSARLVWTNGAFPWPGQRYNGIEVDYVAGFGEGPDDVSEALRLAVKRLVAHAEVKALLGEPVRVGELGSPLPAYPYLEIARHTSEQAGGVDAEASEHRVDLVVVSRDAGGVQAKAALAAVRAALATAELEMDGWRCVLLLPLFSDGTRQRIGLWRALLRMKAVVEAA